MYIAYHFMNYMFMYVVNNLTHTVATCVTPEVISYILMCYALAISWA